MSNKIYLYKNGLILLLLGLFLVPLSAQRIKYLGQEQGLSNRQTFNVCQDKYGFVWISTKTGIDRFDGSRMKTYELPIINSRYASETTYVVSDLTLSVWAFNDIGQIFKFDYDQDQFVLFLNMNPLNHRNFYWLLDMHFSQNGTVYLATELGVCQLDVTRGSWALIKIATLPQRIVKIMPIPNNSLVVSTFNQLFIFSTTSNSVTKIDVNLPQSCRIQSILYDSDATTLWIGTFQHGVWGYNMVTHQTIDLSDMIGSQPFVPVRSLLKASPNRLMIATDGLGIFDVNFHTKDVTHYYTDAYNSSSRLSGNGIYHLFADKDGNIWVCSYTGGISIIGKEKSDISIIQNSPFDQQSIASNIVNAIIEDAQKNIWFGTDKGVSIYTYQKKWMHLPLDAKYPVVLSLCQDDQGRVWVGTYGQGIFVFDKAFHLLKHFFTTNKQAGPIGTNYIFSLLFYPPSSVWAGGRDGACTQINTDNFMATSSVDVGVNSFDIGSNGLLFMGGPQSALILNTQTGYFKYLIDGLYINSIFLDKHDNLYIGTRGHGLKIYNNRTGKIKTFTTQQGLPSNYINHILAAKNVLWLSTENGLTKFDTATNSFTNFFKDDGFPDNSFNRTSGCLLSNGELVLGSNNGAMILNPDNLDDKPGQASIFLEELRLFNQKTTPHLKDGVLSQSINKTNHLNLKYSQHSFSLLFTVVSFWGTGKVKHAWRLIGLDENWNNPTYDRTINYTNLKPGNYLLELKAVDSSGHLLDLRKLEIHIAKPWWNTYTALFGYFICIVLVIRWISLYLKNKLEMKRADEKIAFFSSAAHDLRTPLNLVKAPLQELKGEIGLTQMGRYNLDLSLVHVNKFSNLMEQLLDLHKNSVNKEAISLSEIELNSVISQQVSLFRQLAASRHIQLSFHPLEMPIYEWLDVIKFERIMENLLSNATKYTSENGTIDVGLDVTEKNWSVWVSDTGIGIPKQFQKNLFKRYFRADNAISQQIEGSGIGLLITKKYVAAHNGLISCYSEENQGTTFKITFKRGISHFPAKAQFMSQIPYAVNPFASSTGNDLNLFHQNDQAKNTKQKHKILIAEDNQELREFMRNSLQEMYIVLLAENGKVAVNEAVKYQPELIISDLKMPLMDGVDLCKFLKNDIKTSHIPILVVSAYNQKESLFAALDAGADDYMAKPFDMDILKYKIRNAIVDRQNLRKRLLIMPDGKIEGNALPTPHDQAFIEKAVEIAHTNISDSSFSVNKFSSEMGVSKTVLYDKLNFLVGQPPNEFIKTIRIKHAMKLFEQKTYASVAEVANVCGFDDPRYFSTCFKAFFGQSPSKFLK